MNVFTIRGVDYLHLPDFAEIIQRSKQATRHLVEDGNSIRRLKAFRDGSRLMIPVVELVGYPFVNQGKQLTNKDVYHYQPYFKSSGEHPDGGTYEAGEPVERVLEAINMCADDKRNDRPWSIVWRREMCPFCTYDKDEKDDKKCIKRIVADTIIIPQGDR